MPVASKQNIYVGQVLKCPQPASISLVVTTIFRAGKGALPSELITLITYSLLTLRFLKSDCKGDSLN